MHSLCRYRQTFQLTHLSSTRPPHRVPLPADSGVLPGEGGPQHPGRLVTFLHNDTILTLASAQAQAQALPQPGPAREAQS